VKVELVNDKSGKGESELKGELVSE
jgi:hypothetical protein